MRALVLAAALCAAVAQANRLQQKIYVAARAISFVDPTKHGFRVILHDAFMKNQLAATQLPMLYLTAIPLKRDVQPVVKMIYPDTIYDDKTVNVEGLAEGTWHYICIEWENFSRHNETMGSDCRLFRTLDRMGKDAETTIDEINTPDTDISTAFFRLHSSADFPLRVTITLKGGPSSPPAQPFFIDQPSELEGSIPGLRQFTNYGKLCVLEEPLITGYTAMGRIVQGLSISKCYFNDITTKDYQLSTFESEQAAYRTGAAASSSSVALAVVLLMSVLLRA